MWKMLADMTSPTLEADYVTMRSAPVTISVTMRGAPFSYRMSERVFCLFVLRR